MSTTANFTMPLLFSAQAQKEITHNEAIVLIDALLAGCVVAVATDPASLAPAEGQAWIIGADPVGLWNGRAGQVAVFTSGGWRFAPPVEGMRLLDRSANVLRRCTGSSWTAPAAISHPSGGATVDSEARAAITAILVVLHESAMLAAT